jgi:hypothetical protein
MMQPTHIVDVLGGVSRPARTNVKGVVLMPKVAKKKAKKVTKKKKTTKRKKAKK